MEISTKNQSTSGPRYTRSRSPSPAASHGSIKRQRGELATVEVEMGPLGPFALGSTLTPAEIFALHVTTALPSYPVPSHDVKQVGKYLRIKLSSTDANSLTEAWGRHTVEAYRDIKIYSDAAHAEPGQFQMRTARALRGVITAVATPGIYASASFLAIAIAIFGERRRLRQEEPYRQFIINTNA
ncbi:hypothetical protein K438DRAFT_1764707 [Mycena galopus ATCC 62051]|nr:hypothetical protein K438DRAFT_1764707 [Mycena galopus ATCC 62051]